jgi:hypothetical protein
VPFVEHKGVLPFSQEPRKVMSYSMTCDRNSELGSVGMGGVVNFAEEFLIHI